MSQYNDFYKSNLGFEPYDYQLKVMELLLSGKNIILSVPTGAGKTWAAVVPFLYAKSNPSLHFPKKMIYSSPLRTLTNSIYQDVLYIVKNASIQTGEYNEDKLFEKDIIFSTIDQTLSNFLCFPLPLSQSQANINAGALIGSYLVFDEFHLLDPSRSMATTIGMLKMLGNLTRCCIMTASLDKKFMQGLKENLPNYKIVTLDSFPDDKRKIKSLLPTTNKKKIIVENGTLNAQKIIDTHKVKTIVICNRIESAQKTYQDLIRLQKTEEKLKTIKSDNIICLHSRFFNKDRKRKEERLKHLFGKKADKEEQAILIATQVIEAGMDLSCDVMHTEVSSIYSFLQRAGRCARFEMEKGEIHIYDVLEPEEIISLENAIEEEDKIEISKLNKKYLPYSESECKKALVELRKHQTLDGDIPIKMVESIAKQSADDLIEQMSRTSGGGFNQGKIKECWNTCTKNNYRDTIRDIQSVEVFLIHESQIQEANLNPYKFQSLGMYKWSLVSWLNKIYKDEGAIPFDKEDWLAMELKEAPDIFLENSENEKYELKKIDYCNFCDIPNQVYLNTKYFGYDPEFGLNWQYDDTFNRSSPTSEKFEKENIFKPLIKDTFYQHNKGVIAAFEKEFLPNLNFTFVELAKYLELSDFNKKEFVQLIKLMIILHDYGKLNENWQKPMQKYQALKNPDSLKEIFAHTDYDRNDKGDEELGLQVGLNTRPAHAGIGAFVAQDTIEELFNNEILRSSVSMAIARHHNPFVGSFPDFEIPTENYLGVQRLLEELSFDLELDTDEFQGKLDGFETEWHGERIAYLFFARILRLCDQKATENLKKYYNE